MSIAAALGLRAALGAGRFAGVQFGNPLGLESVFAVGILSTVLVQSFRTRSAALPVDDIGNGRHLQPSSALLVCTLLIIAAAFSFNLRDPFLSDDYIRVSRAIADPAWAFRMFWVHAGDESYRPLGHLYYSLVQFWAHADPFRWHLCSLALHLLNCALLYLVVSSLWGRRILAFGSALLFGVNGTRPEAVVWTCAAPDLLACCFSLCAALCIVRRPARSRSALDLLALLFLGLAILTKESAYAAPVVIAGMWVAAGRWDVFRAKLLSIGAPLMCLALFAFRWQILGGPGGYVNAATGKPQILSLNPLMSAKALGVRIWAVLLFPVNWEATPRSLLLACAVPLTCVCLAILAYAARPLRSRTAVSLLALTAASALPAIHLCLVGQSAMGSRVFYLPAIGLCVLLAHLAGSFEDVRHAAATTLLLALCWTGILAHNLQSWHRVALLAEQTCISATTRVIPPPPGQVDGVYFFANGFPECVSMKMGR